MRWPTRRGLTVVAIAIVGLSVLVVAGRILAPSQAESPVRSAAPTPTGTSRTISSPTELPSEPMTWSTVPAASSGKAGPAYGRRCPAAAAGRLAWTDHHRRWPAHPAAANFSLAAHGRGEDTIKAMTREQVVVTVSY
jgi:hypothetical protein